MKKTSFFIITAVMMCLAVQGYAQDRHQRGNHSSYRVEQRGHSSGYTRSSASSQRSVRQSPSSSSSQHSRVGTQRPATQQRSGNYRQNSRSAQQSYGNRSAHRPENRSHNYWQSSRPAGPPHAYRSTPPPRYHHHHSYLHHTYHCYFNDWYWYTWGGYHNRFIRHRLYYDRFFDNMLGYYIWGTMAAPTKLEIGNLTLTRYNNTLKVQIGSECSYMDLYIVQQTLYQVGNTMVSVTTGSGYAEIRFYDEYGNEAMYSL